MKIRTKVQIVVFFFLKKDQNVENGEKSDRILDILVLERERVFLLSRIVGDSTVGSLRDKKESRST